jgi:hypothetical protein
VREAGVGRDVVIGLVERAAGAEVGKALDTILRAAEAIISGEAIDPPPALHANTRRKIVQRMLRMVALAVFPLRLLPANRIPRNVVPRSVPDPARQALYPDEDRALLGYVAIHP